MSEEQKPEENKVPSSVMITIELTNVQAFAEGKENAKIGVGGPITNEMLAFYLLDKARDIIKAHNLKLAYQESQSKIQKPGGILNFARKRF